MLSYLKPFSKVPDLGDLGTKACSDCREGARERSSKFLLQVEGILASTREHLLC